MAKKSKGFPDTCQEKHLQEGAPYATNALPMDDPNITDVHLDTRLPYGGTINSSFGEFEHCATKRAEENEKSSLGPSIVTEILKK